MQISVIIPTLNAATSLPTVLHVLTNGALDGIVREVIIADGGSSDDTLEIAERFGANLCLSEKGRGFQLRAGARLARSEWLLFLHADTFPSGDWINEIRAFIHGDRMRAGVFRLRFSEKGLAPFIVSAGTMFRTRIFGMPYGDQGLLVSKHLYDEIGGFNEMELFEDVDIIKRLQDFGRQKKKKILHVFNCAAVTSAERYLQEGYFRRVIRNFICLMMYRVGVPTAKIYAFYTRREKISE